MYLSPFFLFVVVMDKITKDVKESAVKDFFYTDELVLIGDSGKKVEMRYA